MEAILGKLFISHLEGTSQIPLSYATRSLTIIFMILLALVAISSKWKSQIEKETKLHDNPFFTIETTTTLRGIAILILIFGHLSFRCVEGILPFEYAGSWAVTVFLYLSGIGLAKTYGLQKMDRKFWIKRLRRLAFPVWLTFLLFYVLDFLLLRKNYDPSSIVLNFLGIISESPPNQSAWYIMYILVLYGAFCTVSCLGSNTAVKSVGLFLISAILATCSTQSWLKPYLGMWKQYSLVFPTAVLIGLHAQKINGYLKSLYSVSRPIYLGSLLVMLILYYRQSGVFVLSQFLSAGACRETMGILNPLYLLGSLTMASYLLDNLRFRSGLLLLLGNYSFEIFLLHLPFMESYDFFLFRKPLWVFFFLYVGLLVFMSYELRLLSDRMKSLVFRTRQDSGTYLRLSATTRGLLAKPDETRTIKG